MTDTSLLIAGATPAHAAVKPAVIAAPHDADLAPQVAESSAQHQLCEAWSTWCATRRFYGPPPLAAGVLGRLSGKARAPAAGAGDAACGAELMALHLAITAQPPEALERRVFELHYRWRVHNIKAAAAQLGINRQHWYRLLKAFRARVCAASAHILQANLDAAANLPHAPK